MLSTKRAFVVSLLSLCTGVILQGSAEAAMPYYASYPTITLSASGSAPVYQGLPVCTRTVGIALTDAAGSALGVDSVFFVNDTVHVVPSGMVYYLAVNAPPQPDPAARIVAPWYSGYPVVFDTWGRYTVVLQDTVNTARFAKIGTVLIYPAFSTRPSMPLSTVATQLDLTLGQSHIACNPTYENLQVRIRADTITLRYTEVQPTGACIDIYYVDPVAYGPSYDLGTLDVGTYIVKVDTMTLGTLDVAGGFPITGTATIMKDPLSRAATVAIPNAIITGIGYIPCPGYNSPASGFDTVTTTTGSLGGFSLLLPRANYQYTIEAARTGYYAQSIAIDASQAVDPLSFQLIPTTMDTMGALTLTVRSNSAVVESVYVSLQPGRALSICPMLLKAAEQASMRMYTGRNGVASFSEIPLIPFIDFYYEVSYYHNNVSLSKSGMVRLNPIRATSMTVDLGTTDVIVPVKSRSENSVARLSGRMLQVPARGIDGTVSLFDLQGRAALRAMVGRNGIVDLSSLPAGRYAAQVAVPGVTRTGALVLR